MGKVKKVCKWQDHSKGFCGKDCETLQKDTTTEVSSHISTGTHAIVTVVHTPTGITHSHSTKTYSASLAKRLCLDKIAEELRYLADKYDRD